MLSPQSFDRVSSAYRLGYYDGYDGKEYAPKLEGPFRHHDYVSGYKAGTNDKLWDAYYSKTILANNVR